MDRQAQLMRDITADYVLDRLHNNSTFAACWCHVDERYVPWIIGLVDSEVCGSQGECDARYGVVIDSPYTTVLFLPAVRATFEEHSRLPERLCLSIKHWGGIDFIFEQYADMSSGVSFSADETGADNPIDVHIPFAVLNEYLACTLQDPATWVDRTGWIRNPDPQDLFRACMALNRDMETDDCMRLFRMDTNRWLATVRDDVLRQVHALFASR
jgi:hypothetical protein